MRRRQRKHVADHAIDMVIAEPVPVRNKGSVRTAERRRKIAEDFCVRKLIGFNVFRRVGIDHDRVERVMGHFRMTVRRAEPKANTAYVIAFEAPVQRTVQLSDANYPFEISGLAADTW